MRPRYTKNGRQASNRYELADIEDEAVCLQIAENVRRFSQRLRPCAAGTRIPSDTPADAPAEVTVIADVTARLRSHGIQGPLLAKAAAAAAHYRYTPEQIDHLAAEARLRGGKPAALLGTMVIAGDPAMTPPDATLMEVFQELGIDLHRRITLARDMAGGYHKCLEMEYTRDMLLETCQMCCARAAEQTEGNPYVAAGMTSCQRARAIETYFSGVVGQAYETFKACGRTAVYGEAEASPGGAESTE